MLSNTHFSNLIKISLLLFLLFFMSPKTTFADDFQIASDGKLTAYTGPGGDITLPEGISEVGDTVFLKNETITSVTIQEGCLSIGKGAFDGCSNLTNISLPYSLEKIEPLAFARCKNLRQCYLPPNITTIDSFAFRECHALTTIEIPAKTSVIGIGCFCYCDHLENFYVNPNNTHFQALDGVLFSSDMYELIQYPCGNRASSYAVPDGVKIIKRNAFTHSLSLKEVRLSDTVTTLESFAFSSCTLLSEISLPASLETVSEYAFKNASNLCKVYVYNDDINVDCKAFAGDLSVILYGNLYSSIENYARKYDLCFATLDRKATYIRPEKNWVLA